MLKKEKGRKENSWRSSFVKRLRNIKRKKWKRKNTRIYKISWLVNFFFVSAQMFDNWRESRTQPVRQSGEEGRDCIFLPLYFVSSSRGPRRRTRDLHHISKSSVGRRSPFSLSHHPSFVLPVPVLIRWPTRKRGEKKEGGEKDGMIFTQHILPANN